MCEYICIYTYTQVNADCVSYSISTDTSIQLQTILIQLPRLLLPPDTSCCIQFLGVSRKMQSHMISLYDYVIKTVSLTLILLLLLLLLPPKYRATCNKETHRGNIITIRLFPAKEPYSTKLFCRKQAYQTDIQRLEGPDRIWNEKVSQACRWIRACVCEKNEIIITLMPYMPMQEIQKRAPCWAKAPPLYLSMALPSLSTWITEMSLGLPSLTAWRRILTAAG